MVEDNYEQVIDGEPFILAPGESWINACCDCGLVHEFAFEKVRKGIRVTVARDDRRTEHRRRFGHPELMKGNNPRWELARR